MKKDRVSDRRTRLRNADIVRSFEAMGFRWNNSFVNIWATSVRDTRTVCAFFSCRKGVLLRDA